MYINLFGYKNNHKTMSFVTFVHVTCWTFCSEWMNWDKIDKNNYRMKNVSVQYTFFGRMYFYWNAENLIFGRLFCRNKTNDIFGNSSQNHVRMSLFSATELWIFKKIFSYSTFFVQLIVIDVVFCIWSPLYFKQLFSLEKLWT